MAQKGGLGRGLSSLIPKNNQLAANSKQTTPSDVGESVYFDKQNEKSVVKPKKQGQKVVKDIKSTRKAKKVGTTKKVTAKTEPKNQKDNSSVQQVALSQIVPNPHQPRKFFNPEKLQELANSIQAHGVLQPLVVSGQNDGGQYELIAGERRYQASKLAGLSKVPVIIRRASEQEKLELAMIENVQRHDLDPIEEAMGYQKMQQEFDLTQEEVALRTGKSRSVVANAIRLLNLPMDIQRALREGKISGGHAKAILALDDPEKQRALVSLILEKNLTVRQVEDKIKTIKVPSHERKIRAFDSQTQAQENRLAEILGTKVKIKKTNQRGQVLIDFYSDEDLGNLIDRFDDTNV